MVQEIVSELTRLNRDSFPGVRILLGAVNAGSGYNVPPSTGRICFEIRSEDAFRVAEMEGRIRSSINGIGEGKEDLSIRIEIIARRSPGNLGGSHPLVKFARTAMEALDVEPKEEPSISELAALLTHRIPSLTLGLTRGENRHSPNETIQLEPLFDGIAHLLAVLRHMDRTDYAPL